MWTMPLGVAETTTSRSSCSAKAGALSSCRMWSGMSALMRWWPAVATVSPSTSGRPAKVRLSASAEPWRRTFGCAGANTTRVAGFNSALRTSTKSPDPTPALARWRPSRRMMSMFSSSPYGRIARAAVERLPTISMTSPSLRPRSSISRSGRRAKPRPLSAGRQARHLDAARLSRGRSCLLQAFVLLTRALVPMRNGGTAARFHLLLNI